MNLTIHPATSLSEEQKALFNDSLTHAHNPSLIAVLKKTFGWQGAAFIIYSGDMPAGYFPCMVIGKRIVSMPHFSHGGIITSSEMNSADKKPSYDQVLPLISRYFGIDPEKTPDYFIRDVMKSGKHVSDDKVISYIRINGKKADDLIPSHQLSKIRKSREYGVVCKRGGIELLNDFYDIYSHNMHELGSPVLPLKFFANILRFYNDGDAVLFCTYKEDIPVGGAFLMSYFGYFENTWFSTNRKYNNLYPAQLLHYEMISYAADKGGHTYSFGRSTKGSGVHEFKRRWNTEEKIVFWNYSSSPGFDLRKFHILPLIWKNLPYRIATFAGPGISKRII